tara:strand:+ start:2741 stop:3766 length:1026 start_codon:yes stop_codon:yes gene_type:complete
MISYSLANNLYSSSGLLDTRALLERKVEAFWASDFSIDQIDEYAALVCEGDLLLEFSIKDFIIDNLSNVLQTGIGAALEGGITLGSLGAGAPAGVFAEMVNDLVFFGYSAGDMLVSIKGIFSDIMELKETIVEIFSSTLEDTPQDIYNLVQEAISGIGETLENLGLPFEEWMEKITKAFRNLLTKIAKPIGDAIGVFVPIPGADALVQNAITLFADDAFKTFIDLYENIPDWIKDVVHDAKALKDTMTDTIMSVVKWVKDFIVADNDEKKSLFDKAVDLASDVASPLKGIIKHSGAGEKLIQWLENSVPGYIEAAIDMLAKVYPAGISALSAITVITNEDY